jgi:hypothetical protein
MTHSSYLLCYDSNSAINLYILCDLAMFIAIDLFWPLYIIKLRDEHVLAIMCYKDFFPCGKI